MGHVWVNVRLVTPITGKEIETKALVNTGARHKSPQKSPPSPERRHLQCLPPMS